MNDISLADQMYEISTKEAEKKVNKYYKKFQKSINKGIAKSCKEGLYDYKFDRNFIPHEFQNAIETLLKEYYENDGFKVYVGIFWITISWDIEEK